MRDADRQMETVFGWPLYLSNGPNKRTLYNFPMQGNGAECLRLAATRLCEAGIVPSMLVHDAVLLEVRDRDQIAQAIEIMKAASRDVCGGFRNRCWCRPAAGKRRALPGQKAGSEANVGHNNARAGRC